MTCGVPQGSILAPLLFKLYMLPLSQIMRNNQIAYHSYADDTQINLASSPNDYSPIDSLCKCIDENNSWMCQNLNKEKTLFGNKDTFIKVNAYLDSRCQTTKNQVKNIGVILETDLSFSSHVKAVIKLAYCHLKTLQELDVLFPVKTLRNLFMPLSPAGGIIVMVSSPAFPRRLLDCCSSSRTLLPGFWLEPENLSISHQSFKDNITLRSLNWLPVTFWIDLKVLLLVYKSLNDLGPKYIADVLTEYKPNRPLRSSQLEILRVHTKQGEPAFSYYAACSLNQLPEEIRCAKTLATFKSSLKTHLFSCAFVEWALCYVRTDCTVFYV